MQASEWTGRVGETWAREWRLTDRSFAGLDGPLERAIVAAVAPGATRLVDIGCGAGTTSLAVARAVAGATVVGVDLSPDLVAVADVRRRAMGVDPARCRFMVGDVLDRAGTLAPVDLFLSRHGVMFFDDPVAAFTRLASAAAPGAALVFSCYAGPGDNPWATETVGLDATTVPASSAPGPFAFADPGRVGAMLRAAGWRPARPPECVAFRYVAGSGADPVADAVAFFQRIGPAARTLREASDADRPALLRRLVAVCERRREGGEVSFPATAWLWRVVRRDAE